MSHLKRKHTHVPSPSCLRSVLRHEMEPLRAANLVQSGCRVIRTHSYGAFQLPYCNIIAGTKEASCFCSLHERVRNLVKMNIWINSGLLLALQKKSLVRNEPGTINLESVAIQKVWGLPGNRSILICSEICILASRRWARKATRVDILNIRAVMSLISNESNHKLNLVRWYSTKDGEI